jgi:hypothetical protein
MIGTAIQECDAPAAHPALQDDPLSRAFIYGLGVAVTIAWFASVIADILIATYATPVALHGLEGTVVGSVFADASLRRARRRIADELRRRDDA